MSANQNKIIFHLSISGSNDTIVCGLVVKNPAQASGNRKSKWIKSQRRFRREIWCFSQYHARISQLSHFSLEVCAKKIWTKKKIACHKQLSSSIVAVCVFTSWKLGCCTVYRFWQPAESFSGSVPHRVPDLILDFTALSQLLDMTLSHLWKAVSSWTIYSFVKKNM